MEAEVPAENSGRPVLPDRFDINAMATFCSHDIPRSRTDPRAEMCCTWLGCKGSYNLIPTHMRFSPESERIVCGKLRYTVNGKQYSPRNLAFLYLRPDDVPNVPFERFRLISLCKRVNCINPWHHSVNKARRSRMNNTSKTKNGGIGSGHRAERLIHTPDAFMHKPMSDWDG